MALTVTAVPGKQFSSTEAISIPKLNQLGQPTFSVTGTVGTSELTAGSVTATKTKADAHFYTNSVVRAASGIGGVSDKYTLTFPGSIGPASLADGVIIAFKVSATNTGRIAVDAGVGGEKEAKKNYNVNIGAGDLRLGQIVEMRYDSTNTTWQLLTPTGQSAALATVAEGRNIASKSNAAIPATQLDITADSVVLMDSSNNGYAATGVSVIINSQATGSNALDTGVLAAGWYYTFLIYNGTTVAGLISLSSTAPTMPAGYTYKALIGAVYATTGSNIRRFYQIEREIFQTPVLVFTAKTATAAVTYEILAGADLTAFRTGLPPIAKTFKGIFSIDNSTAFGLAVTVSAANDSGALDTTNIISYSVLAAPTVGAVMAPQGSANSYGTSMPFSCLVRGGASYNIQWQARQNTSPHILEVTGFTL